MHIRKDPTCSYCNLAERTGDDSRRVSRTACGQTAAGAAPHGLSRCYGMGAADPDLVVILSPRERRQENQKTRTLLLCSASQVVPLPSRRN